MLAAVVLNLTIRVEFWPFWHHFEMVMTWLFAIFWWLCVHVQYANTYIWSIIFFLFLKGSPRFNRASLFW